MITLFNTHFSAAGSTSLHVFLDQHPQIFSSKTKEPAKSKAGALFDWDNYYNQWHPFEDGNVYLDATPHLFNKKEFGFEEARKTLCFDRFCAICVLRNQIDYLISLTTNPTLPERGFEPLKRYIYGGGLYAKQLDNLTDIIGRENIFIIHLKDIEEKQKDIYKFLNVDVDYYFPFPHINSFLGDDLYYNGKHYYRKRRERYFKLRKQLLDNFWRIEDFIERDKKELQEKYGIGDLK